MVVRGMCCDTVLSYLVPMFLRGNAYGLLAYER